MSIGEEIKRLREKRNWTQYALAKEVGTTQHCISQIENGTKDPSRRLFSAIIDKLSDSETCKNSDFFSIVSSILQFLMPGCRCTILNEHNPSCLADICVELPNGLQASLNIQTNPRRTHDPKIQSFFNAVSEDLTLRDSIQTVFNNEELKMYLLETVTNSAFRKILTKLYNFKENPTELDFFEAYLDTVLKKTRSHQQPPTH